MVTRIKAKIGSTANAVVDIGSLIAPQNNTSSIDKLLGNPQVQAMVMGILQKVSAPKIEQIAKPKTFDEALNAIEGHQGKL